MFQEQIGKTMEVYVDDMLVKSIKQEDHLADLRETFHVLRQHQMKLNPAKCAFGVASGKVLGYMVHQRGIEANPEKIQALLNMKSPATVKEVQKLTGKIAALNRFVSRATDRCIPFFKALTGKKRFEWTDKCESAFQELKQYLGSPPLLSKPVADEMLYVYLAVSSSAVSAVLVRQEGAVQNHTYLCIMSAIL